MSKDYVDGKKFFEEITTYVDAYNISLNNDEDAPRISEYIGKCFWDIANGLAKRYNFRNYPFKEEMVGDAVLDCVRYAHKFDKDNAKANLFNYFTQICFYAFVRRIQKEKKYLYTKYKVIDDSEIFGLLNDAQDEKGKSFLNDIGYNESARENMLDFIETFEQKEQEKKEKKKNS